MSTKVPQNQEDQEVDLKQISKKINNFLESVKTSIFNGIQFFVRNWIIVLILIVAGFAIGWYLDENKKAYESEIIVAPNFGSVDYLYSKIELIQSKIASGDTSFLKKTVGIKNSKNLKKIEIKPITDVYSFIKNKPENFELIKLLGEDGDINKVILDNVTSKNYDFQKIIISTKEKTNEENVIKPLLYYLNQSDYYKKIQAEVCNNTKLKIKQNDSIIKQIDAILLNFSNVSNKNDKLLYNNENPQLNDIIKTKENLIIDQGSHKIQLIGFDKIVKETSISLNIEALKFSNEKLKFLFPILFILFFVFLSGFNSFYKKQKEKSLS